MARDTDKMELEGIVTKCLKGGKFEVEVDVNGAKKTVTCKPSGKLRQNYIKIIPNDKVTVNVSIYDLSKGYITWRDK